MDVQINSDNVTDFRSDNVQTAEDQIRSRLDRFSRRLTRVELHLRDHDGPQTRTADGLEAMLEARPAGGQPLAVSHKAREPLEALGGALAKLVARLDSAFGKADRVRVAN
ncbi:hypothetical protein SLG_04230 [Sphingobium sp. SYK-6]|uniref:hypothetical protein n=1 Tax=Sphingobium sp. (strain NBRC 103272 / SYK-6) TaxID=627192 RepID=UPI0002276663|nr:hypothetical protein [Sphingobium sp. SYK-6]BAK65098.1 hypothetical protein SLG_04230 [Sphingobium sp. SYK-6]